MLVTCITIMIVISIEIRIL